MALGDLVVCGFALLLMMTLGEIFVVDLSCVLPSRVGMLEPMIGCLDFFIGFCLLLRWRDGA